MGSAAAAENFSICWQPQRPDQMCNWRPWQLLVFAVVSWFSSSPPTLYPLIWNESLPLSQHCLHSTTAALLQKLPQNSSLMWRFYQMMLNGKRRKSHLCSRRVGLISSAFFFLCVFYANVCIAFLALVACCLFLEWGINKSAGKQTSIISCGSIMTTHSAC